MALRSPLKNLRGGNPKAEPLSRSWRSGLREAGGAVRKGGLHRAAAREEATTTGGGSEGERGEEVVAARRRRFARPAAVLRFVREVVEQGARKAG